MIAVAFSALLIYVQAGLLVGMFSLTSNPIDHASADIWVGHPMNLSVDLGRPIPERWLTRVAAEPEIVRAEAYILAMIVLDKSDGRSELCTVIGSRLSDGALGAVRELTPELRTRLTELGAVVADESDMARLRFRGIGDIGEVLGRRVRLVGTVSGVRSLAAPYLFCSIETARMLFHGLKRKQSIFVLASCRNPDDAPAVVRRLRAKYPDMSAFTAQQFAARTRLHWITTTKAGIAVAWSAVLALLVGLVITSQTLYAATTAARREYAVLEALGIPRWRMVVAVLKQSLCVGSVGVAVALVLTAGLTQVVELIGARLLFPPWLLVTTTAITLGTALLAGLVALRSLRTIEPAELLR
jgi:putative ABC transport system permease protein